MLVADFFCFLSPSLPSLSSLPGHDVTRDTLIKFSRGTRPHHSPHGQDWLLCHSYTHHTHTRVLLWCGLEPSSLFCGPSNYRVFLCEVYFRGCSALSMFSSYNGLVYMWPKSNTLTWMQAFASLRCWPFDAWRLGFWPQVWSSVAMRRAFILVLLDPIITCPFCVLKENTSII